MAKFIVIKSRFLGSFIWRKLWESTCSNWSCVIFLHCTKLLCIIFYDCSWKYRLELRRCIKTANMFYFWMTMLDYILVQLERWQQKWRKIPRSIIASFSHSVSWMLEVADLSRYILVGLWITCRYLFKLDILLICPLGALEVIVYMNITWYAMWSPLISTLWHNIWSVLEYRKRYPLPIHLKWLLIIDFPDSKCKFSWNCYQACFSFQSKVVNDA